MKLFIATANIHKQMEISAILKGLGIDYLVPKEGELPEVDETGGNLFENAIVKAKAGFEYSGLPALADDTGLEVDYLNGAPGVLSARFAGPICSYDDNNRKLIGMLAGVKFSDRTARFRTVIALAFDSDCCRTVEGLVNGVILEQPRGLNGFGYDPLFFYPPLNKTLAELDAQEKNSISHRGRALAELKNLLREGILPH